MNNKLNYEDMKELGSRNDDDLSDSPCEYCGDRLTVDEVEIGEVACNRCRWQWHKASDPSV